MKRLAIIALLLCGCCTCPPPPVTDVRADVNIAQWASIAGSVWYDNADVVTIGLGQIDSVSVAEIRLPTIEEEIRVELAKMAPAEPLGPWPCRWVYGTRIEETACPDANKQTYSLKDGAFEFNGLSMAVCAVLHTKTVRDSIWHCGPDNGVFTR